MRAKLEGSAEKGSLAEKRQRYEAFAKNELSQHGIVPERLGPQESELYTLAIQTVGEALVQIHLRFEQQRGSEAYFEYHNTVHTQTVIQDTIRILAAVHRTEDPTLEEPASLEDIFVGMIEAAWHDTTQDFTRLKKVTAEMQTLKRVRPAQRRHRFWGEYLTNERKSADELSSYLEGKVDPTLFSDRARKLLHPDAIRKDIETTIPTFGNYPDSDIRTVYQKNLNEESSLTAKALAFADLASSGWMSALTYMEDSRKNFMEEDLDIYKMIYDDRFVNVREQQNIRQRVESFMEREVAFANGRYIAFQREIALFGEHQESVRSLYTNFVSEETFKAFLLEIEENHQILRQLPFRTLMNTIGYQMGEMGAPGAVKIENEILSGNAGGRG